MIDYNNRTQISRAGCYHVCGHGADYYSWSAASQTITTWLLPVVGTLLQAPFESNATKRTLLAIARWCGSPIASLSYVLWNIKVSAKAAVMVDMAVDYNQTPDLKTDFGSMRDSMYLLLAMNQYTLKDEVVSSSKEAEGLLRVVLFSRDLKLTDTNMPLRKVRRILANELRQMRRRGAVPVFVSIMWFLFAFALSVQAAFGDLGENTTAHDLALGCLLAWFPILIMGSIVDRNPIAAEAIRIKLNTLVDHVRHALTDEKNCNDFISSFGPQPNQNLENKIKSLVKISTGHKMKHFFEDFAGQGRVRWHYGAAHAILSDIENCYVAERGRNWLANEAEARASLVTGPSNDEGLVWFDVREFWQVSSAIIIVAASCGGAFILSFFTPTVGLGCRSGGYTVFFTISLGLPAEVVNTIWLVYIVLSQTFGWYKTCDCVTSGWGGGGGYLDFDVQTTVKTRWVIIYWTTGAALTGTVMALSMFYITVEWCQQSFLSTEDYTDAMKGLRLTRAYRRYTYIPRRFARFMAKYTLDRLENLAFKCGLINAQQQTLRWEGRSTRKSTAPPAAQPVTIASGLLTSVDIRLTDFDSQPLYSPHIQDTQAQDTPALAISSFPDAIPANHQRTDSGSFLQSPPRPSYQARNSGDSGFPLLPRPSEAHHGRDSSSSDERRRSREGAITPVSIAGESSMFAGWQGLGPQPRQSYRRANSGSGLDLPQPNQDVLGISMDDRDLERGESSSFN
ncbi:hypothetical protein N0V87_002957 [Didymella glomerata]|uniref:Uncharacterized protein n=1 Tax=Didymella glomerata TaxID=749621 RepID=A0A9W8X455_9PLEO|nr:hypothetical protein N0V87_002957 [Didymella glomerata]